MIINPSTLTSGIKVIPSDSINIPGPQLKFSGVTTADLASKLEDTTAPARGGFEQTLEAAPNDNQVATQGIQTGDVVYNTSTARPGVAIVTAIDSNNTLSLSADIFVNATTTRDGYAIYEGNGANVNAYQLYIGTGGNIYVTTNMGDELFIENVQDGTVLPVVVARVNVGAAAAVGNGNTNTLTSATEIVALT